jgi:hypothetical protein
LRPWGKQPGSGSSSQITFPPGRAKSEEEEVEAAVAAGTAATPADFTCQARPVRRDLSRGAD